jgi:hypothetical protein
MAGNARIGATNQRAAGVTKRRMNDIAAISRKSR